MTNNRPTNYSKWHRTLDKSFLMTDGDWFEQRWRNSFLEAVAYIETIEIPNNTTPKDYPVWLSKIALAKQIDSHMVQSFYVWHTSDCKKFFVQKIDSKQYYEMSEDGYKNFLKRL